MHTKHINHGRFDMAALNEAETSGGPFVKNCPGNHGLRYPGSRHEMLVEGRTRKRGKGWGEESIDTWLLWQLRNDSHHLAMPIWWPLPLVAAATTSTKRKKKRKKQQIAMLTATIGQLPTPTPSVH